MIEAWPQALGGFEGIFLGLALGLLAGIQRGWVQRNEVAGTRFAGIRTFGLLGLAGGIAGELFTGAEAIAVILLAAASGLILIGFLRTSERAGSVSGTTSLAGLITVACGFLAATDRQLAAVAITVFMVLLLALRPQLHRMLRGMSEAEVLAIARFALIAVVILPLLPDRPYGPYDAWNPQKLWLVVVLVSGLSLAGYVTGKLLGPTRGTLATAAAGAVVSSTAVTASMATRIKGGEENAALLHTGIALASVVMFLRLLLLVGALAPFALPSLAVTAIPGLIVSLISAIWLYRQARRQPATADNEVRVRNPFAIGPALLLMALVMAMSLAARWVLARYGDAELAVVLALSGMVDVDSAVITMGTLPLGALHSTIAGLVLLPPIFLNTLFKAGVAVSIAGWRQARPALWTLGLTAMALLAAVPLALFLFGLP